MKRKFINYVFLASLGAILSACSHFTLNATICEQIASDPLATMPEECKIYNEKEAQKSFDNAHNTRMESNESIEFRNDQ